MRRLTTAALCALSLATAAPIANAQTVSSNMANPVTIVGPITSNVRADMMGAFTVTATWSNATTSQYTFGFQGAGNWGFNGAGLSLLVNGASDTYNAWWSINNSSSLNLMGLAFDATGSNVLFDRNFGMFGNQEGTAGSDVGSDFEDTGCWIVFCGDLWSTTAVYKNPVILSPAGAPVGDLFKKLEVSFNNGGINKDQTWNEVLRFDTDIHPMSQGGGSAAIVTPEPSTYALMFAGLAALGFAARRRRQVLTA